jgi:phytoene dehydrogenase-like protein
LGGYLNPFRRQGYRFDTGMHYPGQLGEGGVFRGLLERLGVWGDVSFNEVNPDGFIRFVCEDLEFSLPASEEAIEARLCERFPEERRNVRRFLSTILKIDRAVEAAAEMNTGIRPWFKALPHLPFLLPILPKTYWELVSACTRNPQLQSVLCMMNSGLPAEQASALIPSLMFRHYLDGAFYPQGGSGALRDALVKAIGRNGGELRNNTRVVGIRRQRTGFIVETESERFGAKSVMCNADPTVCYGSLLAPDMVSSRMRRRIAEIAPSISAF